MNSCFLFGHGDSPDSILPLIENRVEQFYLQHDVQIFYVGSRGRFDQLAATAVKRVKKKYPCIQLILLLAYHPFDQPVVLTEGFDNSFYPPLEAVPKRYAIVHANRYMLSHADTVICYVNHGGNTRQLLSMARKRQEKEGIIVENLGQRQSPQP